MKTENNQVYTETRYKGDAIFGGKNFYELVAELNATKTMLSKNDPQELGQKIYNGTIKLISRKGGESKYKEIKWPIILEDDERKWTNVKPVIATTVLPPPHSECECDICIEE